ncbi:hypothetical protein HDU85_000994 [Gaertneriomyces sp. JEL0708]|nr:hypothetical protein HDU85_000994 [Gaertneriomyces sp. JEL0708]
MKYRIAVFPSEGTYSGVEEDCKLALDLAASLPGWTDVSLFSGLSSASNAERANELCANREVLSTCAKLFSENFEYGLSRSDSVFLIFYLGHGDAEGALLFPAWGWKRIPVCNYGNHKSTSANLKGLINRFVEGIKERDVTNQHLILVADSCYSGQLVADLAESAFATEAAWQQFFRKQKSSISIQASAAWWQQAFGGVFTPYYCNHVRTKLGVCPNPKQPPDQPTEQGQASTTASTPPQPCPLVDEAQYPNYKTIGALPNDLRKAFLFEEPIPIIDSQSESEARRKTQAKQDPLNVHDIKLGRTTGDCGHELFAHVENISIEGFPKTFIAHIHVKEEVPASTSGKSSATSKKRRLESDKPKRVVCDVREERRSAAVDAEEVNFEIQFKSELLWMWVDPPRKTSVNELEKKLKNIIVDAVDIKLYDELRPTLVFASNSLECSDITSCNSDGSEYKRFNGYLFMKRTPAIHVKEITKARDNYTVNEKEQWVEEVFQKAKELFEDEKARHPKNVVYVRVPQSKTVSTVERRRLEDLAWDDLQTWHMACSLKGSFRNRNPLTGFGLRDCIPPPLGVSELPAVSLCAIRFEEARRRFNNQRVSFNNAYCGWFTLLLHYHLGTYLYRPEKEVRDFFASYQQGDWDNVHLWAYVILRHGAPAGDMQAQEGNNHQPNTAATAQEGNNHQPNTAATVAEAPAGDMQAQEGNNHQPNTAATVAEAPAGDMQAQEGNNHQPNTAATVAEDTQNGQCPAVIGGACTCTTHDSDRIADIAAYLLEFNGINAPLD